MKELSQKQVKEVSGGNPFIVGYALGVVAAAGTHALVKYMMR